MLELHDWLASKPAPATKREAYKLLFEYLVELSEAKNHDYSPENIRLFGEVGVAVRVGDKALRLKSLVVDKRGAQVSQESVDDTWIDISNYALIALLLRNDWWDLPWADD